MIYLGYFKRPLDIAFAILLAVSFSWLILIILLAYLVSWNLPIFFRQSRIGKDAICFTMWKFRTLNFLGDVPNEVKRFGLGNFLRATSMDELPQLVNVLKGDMSMVGPRPLPEAYFHFIKAADQVRHTIRPGVTGLVQVSGRHTLSWMEKFELDSHYVSNLSFWMDLKIIYKTILVILSFRKDISLEEKPLTGF